jgi:hypothetical protein
MSMQTTADIHLRWDAAGKVWQQLIGAPTAGCPLPEAVRGLFLLAHRGYTLTQMQQEFGHSHSTTHSGRGRPSRPLHTYLQPGWLAKFFLALQDEVYGFNHVLPSANPMPARNGTYRPRIAAASSAEHRKMRDNFRRRSLSFAKVLRPLTFQLHFQARSRFLAA